MVPIRTSSCLVRSHASRVVRNTRSNEPTLKAMIRARLATIKVHFMLEIPQSSYSPQLDKAA